MREPPYILVNIWRKTVHGIDLDLIIDYCAWYRFRLDHRLGSVLRFYEESTYLIISPGG